MWFALAASLIPIIFMVGRGRAVEMDDLTYAAVMWKFLLVYAIVRLTVRSRRDVTVALWVSLVAAVLVGVIGILQSLDLLGVRALLEPLFAPFGYSDVVQSARAGSTVGLPAATADLMVLNLVIVLGLVCRKPALARYLAPVALLLVVAVFSAAEFSSVLGLMVATVCVARSCAGSICSSGRPWRCRWRWWRCGRPSTPHRGLLLAARPADQLAGALLQPVELLLAADR